MTAMNAEKANLKTGTAEQAADSPGRTERTGESSATAPAGSGAKKPRSCGRHPLRTASRAGEQSLALATVQIRELLRGFDPAALREAFAADPVQYTRLLNTLARLVDAAVRYERYGTEIEERKARLRKAQAATQPGGLTDEAIAEMQMALNLM